MANMHIIIYFNFSLRLYFEIIIPMYGYKDDLSPVSRLCLHAYRICFIHPVTGRRMKFETPLPDAFAKLMEI